MADDVGVSVAVSTLVLLGVLVVVVVATLVVENWGRIREPLAPTGPGTAPTGGGAAEPVRSEEVAPVAAVARTAAAGPAEGTAAVADGPSGTATVRVPVSERTLAVLFASYATARMPEDRRAAAWVTAAARPPGRPGAAFRPGADLRGRPAAVQQLLDCDDQGRCWVALNPEVDIALGVARRPPRCPVLAALVQLWADLAELPVELDVERTAALRRAVGRLGPTWSTTTGARHVAPLARALRTWTPEGGPRVVLAAPPA
jgi:hypothetical protein